MISEHTKQTIRAFLRTYKSKNAFSLFDYLEMMEGFGWTEKDINTVLKDLEEISEKES